MTLSYRCRGSLQEGGYKLFGVVFSLWKGKGYIGLARNFIQVFLQHLMNFLANSVLVIPFLYHEKQWNSLCYALFLIATSTQ